VLQDAKPDMVDQPPTSDLSTSTPSANNQRQPLADGMKDHAEDKEDGDKKTDSERKVSD